MWRADMTRPELAAITAMLAVALAGPAAAQDDAGSTDKRPTVSRAAPPSSNSTINLINLLVKQGVLTEEQAAGLIKQADDEAYIARQAVRDATAKAEGAQKSATTATEAVSPPGTKRVTYVPEIVKKQLRDDIKKEVMAQAQKENWASPGQYPEWASRIRFFGDVRVRYEGDYFPAGNDRSTANFNSINTGNPYAITAGGVNNPYFWPTYNVDQDRQQVRLRARLGMEADLFDGFYAGIRIATGSTNAPVSFNQSLGGSGGNFSKYSLWLDRGFIKYSPWSSLAVQAGRFDNPFFNATDLVFHRDLGFDGFATQVKHEVMPGITPFFAAGAFPVFNTDLNVGTSLDYTNANAVPAKSPSHDKWMFGGQLGSNFRVMPEVDFTFAGAYYAFTGVQGSLSAACFTVTSSDVCSTDLTRPSFAQRGNTYMALRNIVQQDPANPNIYQYFGLASAFQDVVVSGRVDLNQFNPVHVILDGEYVRNVAWNRNDVAAKALANPLPAGPAVAGCTPSPCNSNTYVGGNQGWMARMTVGYPELKQLWDWNVHVGYKWLQSDAVIDAFTDSDFGLGGTNLKGYIIGGNLAVGPNVWLSARWMSANQVAGVPYAVDIFQLDLNARF